MVQMDKNKFDAIFPIITASLTDKIITHFNLPEDKALLDLYETELYAALENEETKVWQYSVEKLFDLYKNEKQNGILELPKY
jgi:hypothetical protein